MPFKGFSKGFWLMCLASLFFFASFNMIIPELPNLLRKLGGIEYLGWNIAAFSVLALVSRPLSGLLTDKIGRIPVMVIGAVISVLVGLTYPLIGSIGLYFILRAIHGIAAGFTPTANVAFIDDVVSKGRKGEAMGVVGVSNVIGMSSGPPIGSWLAETYDLDYTFFGSSALALFALIIFLSLKETLPAEEKERFSIKLLSYSNLKFYEPKALAPSLVMLLTVYSFGAMLTLVPDYSLHCGLNNKGIFFTYMVLASMLSRLTAGKLSDKKGRREVGIFGALILTVGMTFLAFADSRLDIIVSACVLGFGQGILSPTLFAWAIDVANPKAKRKAITTLFMALEIGVILGALVPALIYQDNPDNFTKSFLTAATVNAAALVYLLFKRKAT